MGDRERDHGPEHISTVLVASMDQIKQAVREVLRERQLSAEPEPYLTVEDAAKLMRTHARSVQHWARTGKLQHVRAGNEYRFTREAIDEFLTTGRRP